MGAAGSEHAPAGGTNGVAEGTGAGVGGGAGTVVGEGAATSAGGEGTNTVCASTLLPACAGACVVRAAAASFDGEVIGVGSKKELRGTRAAMFRGAVSWEQETPVFILGWNDWVADGWPNSCRESRLV